MVHTGVPGDVLTNGSRLWCESRLIRAGPSCSLQHSCIFDIDRISVFGKLLFSCSRWLARVIKFNAAPITRPETHQRPNGRGFYPRHQRGGDQIQLRRPCKTGSRGSRRKVGAAGDGCSVAIVGNSHSYREGRATREEIHYTAARIHLRQNRTPR